MWTWLLQLRIGGIWMCATRCSKAHRKSDWREQERQRLWSWAVMSAWNRPRLCTFQTALSSASHSGVLGSWQTHHKKKGERKRRKGEYNKTRQEKARGGRGQKENNFPRSFCLWRNMSRPPITVFYFLGIWHVLDHCRQCWLPPCINAIKLREPKGWERNILQNQHKDGGSGCWGREKLQPDYQPGSNGHGDVSQSDDVSSTSVWTVICWHLLDRCPLTVCIDFVLIMIFTLTYQRSWRGLIGPYFMVVQ